MDVQVDTFSSGSVILRSMLFEGDGKSPRIPKKMILCHLSVFLFLISIPQELQNLSKMRKA